MDDWNEGLKQNGLYYEGWVTDADKVVALHGKATVTCYGTRRSQSYGGKDKENTGENQVMINYNS